MQCLLLVGLGVNEGAGEDQDGGESEEDEDAVFSEFDPDELPGLVDAIKILFPSLRQASTQKGKAEEDYELEMLDRLRRFHDIPPSTPDLSTHMEDLAWQYPAEPVERAAVRFCEAVAKWRGKPELETKPNFSGDAGIGMSIESLVHSNPTSPVMGNANAGAGWEERKVVKRKPSIDVYFTAPLMRDAVWSRGNSNKRGREAEDGGVGSPPKRIHS